MKDRLLDVMYCILDFLTLIAIGLMVYILALQYGLI